MNDKNIIDAYWQRSETAISMSSQKYGAYCRTVAYNILSDISDSEECVNDTWLNAWNAIPPHRPNVLRTFFGKITRNLAFNRYKQKSAAKRGGELPLALEELNECIPSCESIERETESALITAAIESFLLNETSANRSIFLRRYFYVQSIKRIAADFVMSESKVTSILFRMRIRLKNHLEKEGIYL